AHVLASLRAVVLVGHPRAGELLGGHQRAAVALESSHQLGVQIALVDGGAHPSLSSRRRCSRQATSSLSGTALPWWSIQLRQAITSLGSSTPTASRMRR